MDFSRLKLNEGIATGDYTGLSAEKNASERALSSSQNKVNRNSEIKTAKTKLSSQPTGVKTNNQTVMSSYQQDVDKYFQEMRQEVEKIKSMEGQKSDWRSELNEKVMDGQEEEQHPYVTVMPTGDEAIIQAMKQMGGEVKNKKKQAQAAGIGAGGGDMQEEIQSLEEKKKKGCKDGYKRDEDGNCVKKEKSKTYIRGGGYGWGYGGHHHDHDEPGEGEGGDGGGGDGGGGMGEMFDILGDMLLQEKEMNLRDAQKAGVTVGNPHRPINHRKLNADRVKGYVPPKTTDKERAKD